MRINPPRGGASDEGAPYFFTARAAIDFRDTSPIAAALSFALPDASTLTTFIAALLVLEITPGPDMMLVMARGIGQGRRTALLTVAGMVFVAGPIQVGLLVLGLATLLTSSPTALLALQWAGAVYMLYLGVKMIRSSREQSSTAPIAPLQTSAAALREGALNSLTNPKSLLFMFAFLPQFVDPAAGPIWSQLLVLGTIQKLAGVLSLGAVALAAGSIGQWLTRWPRLLIWQQRFTGAVLIALGARLLTAGHSGSMTVVGRA